MCFPIFISMSVLCFSNIPTGNTFEVTRNKLVNILLAYEDVFLKHCGQEDLIYDQVQDVIYLKEIIGDTFKERASGRLHLRLVDTDNTHRDIVVDDHYLDIIGHFQNRVIDRNDIFKLMIIRKMEYGVYDGHKEFFNLFCTLIEVFIGHIIKDMLQYEEGHLN